VAARSDGRLDLTGVKSDPKSSPIGVKPDRVATEGHPYNSFRDARFH